MNVLLHICCAPCTIFPLEDLRREGHLVGGFFYNPNIHPYSEYLKRKDEVAKFAKNSGLTVTYSDYDVEKFFQNIVYNEAAELRCPVCWWMRIEKAAKFAKENGFDAFTTTLLGSPYQNHDVLKSICEDVANVTGIAFHYKDFRPGFKAAQDKARAEGIYLQNYCGCLFSEMERLQKKDKPHNKKK